MVKPRDIAGNAEEEEEEEEAEEEEEGEEEEKDDDEDGEEDECIDELFCLFVAWRPSGTVYLRMGSAQTMIRATRLKQK